MTLLPCSITSSPHLEVVQLFVIQGSIIVHVKYLHRSDKKQNRPVQMGDEMTKQGVDDKMTQQDVGDKMTQQDVGDESGMI